MLPTEPDVLAPESALAVPSGATLPFPPNHDFQSGPLFVGNGPTNYDFSNGGNGWTTSFGNVTYSGGIATLSDAAQIVSSSYSLASTTQAVKIVYKYQPVSTAVVAIFVGPTAYGTDDLACPIGCTPGAWVEKYIGVYTSAQGQTVTVRINQTSGTTEVEELGTQWISFQEWRGPTTGVGIKSQPKLSGGQLAEVRSTLRTGDFLLTENLLEFDYSFPLPSGNTLSAFLHRASDDAVLSAMSRQGNSVGWTRAVWTWFGDNTGQSVYIRFTSTDAQPSWIDNVGINLVEAFSLEGYPSADAGDPFDTSTAQSTHSHTDILIPGRGIPLEFTRYYNSMAGTAGDLGYNWRHTYSSSLRVDSDQSVRVSYGSGGSAYFKYNTGSYVPPAGVYDTLVKNIDNTYTLTKKNQIRYNFDTSGKLATISDRNNNTTTLTYTGGLLTSVTDASTLRSLTFTYDGSNRIFRVTDPLPSPNTRTVEFTYDPNGDLSKVKDVKADPTNGPFTIYTYSNHRMTTLTDSNGPPAQSMSIYDGAGRVAEQTDGTGGKTCSYYGTPPAYTSPACPVISQPPAAGQTVVVNPLVKRTTYDFDTKFRTTGVTDHNGGVTTFTYDSSNNVSCITDQRLKKTSYSYDTQGNVLEMIDAANTDGCGVLKAGGVKWVYTYTPKNDLDSETLVGDPLGRNTDYVYDDQNGGTGNGNLTRIIRKGGSTNKALTCFERDGFGQVTAVVESTTLVQPPGGPTAACPGNRTLFGYDTYGNQTCVVNARHSATTTCASDPGKKATFIYDLGGRLRYSTDELTNISRPVRGSMPEIGSQCGPDGNGNGSDDDNTPIDDDSTIDDGCPSTEYTYDAQNNVRTVTDGLGNITTSEYDAKGNLKSVKDANRVTAGASPESGSAQCGTEGTGDGINNDGDAVTDDGCLSIAYRYDAADRLEKVIQAAVSTTSIPTTTYGYDGNGNRTSVTNPKRQAVGDAEPSTQCKVDTDVDGHCNSFDLDDDSDGVYDVDEAACGGNTSNASIRPERTDGVFANVSDDGDAAVNEALPAGSENFDCDGDGWTGNQEKDIFSVSTTVHDQDPCGNNGWPADLQPNNKVDIGDTGSFTAPNRTGDNVDSHGSFNYFSHALDDDGDTAIETTEAPNADGGADDPPTYNVARWNLQPPHTASTPINIGDMGAINPAVNAPTARPPMFGGQPAFYSGPCSETGSIPPVSPGPYSECGFSGTGDVVDGDADTVIDDGCPSTRHAYDALNRLQSVTDALGRVTSYQYDAASNLTQRTDARGLVTKYFPDNLNRLDLIEHWSGSTLVDSVNYEYDEVGNRKEMVDPSGPTRYSYDPLDRLTCVGPNLISGPCPSGNVAYDYDNGPGPDAADYPGQRTKITYPDGKVVNYTYEKDGRMKTVTDWLAKQTVYTYDDAGRLIKTQYPNTVWTDYTYDAADRLSSVVNKKTGPVTISSFTYTLDAVGSRTQMADLLGTYSYQYDSLYRLTSVSAPLQGYTYDSTGNRITKTCCIDIITRYQYDVADQLTCVWVSLLPNPACPSGSTIYTYDANGNQKSRGADTFTYDHENRLKQAIIGGATSTSTYNGDGLRMSRTAGGVTTSYTWDVAAGLPVVLQDGTNTYVYGLDLISATDSGGAQTYFLYDGLGSTTGLTDGSGNNPVSYSYDVFGAIQSQTGTSANYWLFTGEQRDSGSNFYYLRARYYDPSIGRFLSQDPLPTGNLYAYVGNNPVNFVDPSGLCHQGPLVILKGEKGPVYAPIFTSKQEEVGFNEYGDCVSAHQCKLVLDRYCSSGGFDPIGEVIGFLGDCCFVIAQDALTAFLCLTNPLVQGVATVAGAAAGGAYYLINDDPYGAAGTAGAAYVTVWIGGCTLVVTVAHETGVNPLRP